MGSYVKVVGGIVIDGIVADQEFIDTLPDKVFWYETSYNIRGGIYYDNATGQPHEDQSLATATPGRKRKNYAGIRLSLRQRTRCIYSTDTVPKLETQRGDMFVGSTYSVPAR
jgi:hypothetical protein